MPIRDRIPPQATADQIRRAADFCQETYDAKRFFDWVATQPSFGIVQPMNVRSVTDAIRIDRRRAIEIFKRLAKAEIGGWLAGRHGNPTRMWWKCESNGLGKAVLEELDRREVQPDYDEPGAEAENGSIEHSFKLRPDITLQFNLPQNFSLRDAERLGAWLRTLPFE